MGAKLFRYFQLERGKSNSEKRTVPLAFSSEYPVERSDEEFGDYDEILDHSEDSVDLSRMKDGAPLLDSHKLDRQIGVIEEALISEDKKGRAFARFSKGDLAEQIWQDVQDGIRKHVSVGYELTRVISKGKGENGRQQIRFAWMPYEISIVSSPEDPNTGIGRSREEVTLKTRAMAHQGKAMESAISAVGEALDKVQAMPDRCKSACAVVLTAMEACLSNMTPGTAGVAWEECYEVVNCLRELSDEFSQAAAAACAAACEVCWQVYAGGNRSVDAEKLSKRNKMKILLDPTPAAGGGGAATTEVKPGNVIEIESRSRDAERTRVRNINAAVAELSKKFPEAAEKFRGMADKAIDEGKTSEAFNAELLPAIPGVTKARTLTIADLGMSTREANEYSMLRGIQAVLLRGRPEGLELEVHQEMSKHARGLDVQGFLVPFDIPCRQRSRSRQGRRDLNVNTFGQGGAMVATNLVTTVIDLLRNKMVCERLGVQSMAGLEGNVAIPRQTGAATPYSLPESATLTKSTQAIDQIMLTPHRVGAWNDYTRQLLLQSSIDVENFIRDDLMKVLAIKWDYLILQGAGAGSEPTGILNTIGIGSVIFGGSATWSQMLSFETALSLANADAGNMAYVTTPSVRAKLKAAAKIGSTFPIFIWEAYDWKDDSNDGEVNGYRAAVTNQILNNAVAFGNWEDCIGPAMWGGYDVIVNPYSRDTDAAVRVTVNTFGDVAVRHAASFCWSADSGAQ